MNKPIKLAVITAARSEYGLLRWLISDIEKDPDFELVLVAAGSHLAPDQGMTVRHIEADGHRIAHRIEFLLSSRTDVGVAKSNGLGAISMADMLGEERPEMIVVLGDRYELLGICSTALLLGIPIAHISGGDVTEGAIDNQIRNAVTMMADIHFPGTEESAANIAGMRGSRQNVFAVGEPGLDSFIREERMSRDELADDLGIDVDKKWILCTLHPETKESTDYSLSMAENLIDALKEIDNKEVIITAANADTGGAQLNDYFREVAAAAPDFTFVQSLGHRRYLSMMNEAYAVVGNSSSGIVEAPFLGIPVINIGRRQQGRHICRNVVTTDNSKEEILNALQAIPGRTALRDDYYGDGHTSGKILKHLKDFAR